ncbi:MAG: rhomboid family intramembrane serine protease [Balneolaceae bacterium]
MYQDSFGSAFKRGYMRIPVAIRVIISINVAVFILQALGGGGFNQVLVNLLAFDPQWSVALTQPWRFVTYMFLHGSGFHLLFNMLWLWWMGRPVEVNLGPRTFMVLYFGSGIGGAILNVGLAMLFGSNYVIGASGAVFGIMVAFAVMFPRTPIMLLLLPPIEARFLVAGLIAFDLIFLGAADNVARIVHLGGAGIGYLLIRMHYTGTDLSSLVRSIERLWYRPPSEKRPRNKNMYSVSDVEIMDEKESNELDDILEKISKEGYDALTAEEKKKLFELSKRN